MRELFSALAFHVAPNFAKRKHVVAFQNPSINQTIMIIGTAHYLHLKSNKFPMWELKSAIRKVCPKLVLVEIRSSSIQSGKLGEGPIEMPYCLFVARQLGIGVRGIDDWTKDSGQRENNMYNNIIHKAANATQVLVFVGYSHVYELSQRFRVHSYEEVQLPENFVAELFSFPVDKAYPPGLARAYVKASTNYKPFSRAWAKKRIKLAKQIERNIKK